ncbi:MAG: L-tyrosine/L-tryptophan isonitrile synthase family protein [Oligoflexales bacterium]
MKNFAFGLSANLGSIARESHVQTKQHQRPPLDIESATKLAVAILNDVMLFRRTVDSNETCAHTCPSCHTPHLQKVIFSVMLGRPIKFVLPAFPGKSPNPAKVLGHLPDMAERRALMFLGYLSNRIKQIYAPGIEIIICSDGRVFSDAVGMLEENVTAYQDSLDEIIDELGLTNISTFNLDELCGGRDFAEVRRSLMKEYGKSLASLREKILRCDTPFETPEDRDAQRMYLGITRFLVEDSTFPGQTRSRTAVQKDCKARAYEVILRSNAWSELIAERFEDAVRWSIHPQGCGSAKLGIRLLGNESWMTPWHGVAVDTGKGFVLMKRWEAEGLGAELVLDAKGRPSHFKLASQPAVSAMVEQEANEF